MVWARVVVSGTNLLVCIDDVGTNKSSEFDSEVHRAILFAHIQPNIVKLIGHGGSQCRWMMILMMILLNILQV